MVTKREETPEEFEARYQAMLKKYNIKPDNIALDKGGAASYYEDVKDDSRPAREERDMKSYKEYERKRTKEDETRKSGAVSKSKVEKKKSGSPQSTRRGQTSKGGSKVPLKNTDKEPVKAPVKESVKTPPKKGSKTHPVGGWKEENQDVAGTNKQQYRPNRYGYISKTSDLPNMIRYKGLEQFSDYPKKKKSSSPKPVHQKHTYEDDMTRYNKTSGSNKEKEHAKIADEMKKNGKGFVTPSEAYNRRAKLKLGEVSRKGLIKKLTIEDSKADIRKIKKARKF